jgi:hypothetical protein
MKGEEVMEIAAANADGLASDEDVVVPDDARCRNLADLDRPDAGQEGGSHGCPIIMQDGPIPKDSTTLTPAQRVDIVPASSRRHA